MGGGVDARVSRLQAPVGAPDPDCALRILRVDEGAASQSLRGPPSPEFTWGTRIRKQSAFPLLWDLERAKLENLMHGGRRGRLTSGRPQKGTLYLLRIPCSE